MKISRGAAALLAVFSLGLAATGVAIAAKTVTMSGSTSIAPLATKLASAFNKKTGTKFVIQQGGSDIGINDASRGRVSIGMSSRAPKPADPGGITFTKFARDSICVVTNKSNKIASLSRKQIQDIFSGRIRNWAQVAGSSANGPINLIVRTPASGTQDAFQQIFMGEDLRVAGSASTKSSNGLQAQAISADPNSIGYASFSFVKNIWSIPYQGVPCTLQNAKSGQYGGTRFFWWVTRGEPKGAADDFIDWTKRNSKAQKIISTDWVSLR